MDRTLDVVYFTWMSDKTRSKLTNQSITDQSVYTTYRELSISILSLRKFSPRTNVTVYMTEQDKKALS